MPDKWKTLVLNVVPGSPPDLEGEIATDLDQAEVSDSEKEARKARDEAKAIARKRARRTSFEWQRTGVREYDANKMAMCYALAYQTDRAFFTTLADAVQRKSPLMIKWDLYKARLEQEHAPIRAWSPSLSSCAA